MKITQIDKLGRIVIPIAFRRALGLREDSVLQISLDGDSVVINRLLSRCKLCYASLDNDSSIGLCNNCIEKIKKM